MEREKSKRRKREIQIRDGIKLKRKQEEDGVRRKSREIETQW